MFVLIRLISIVVRGYAGKAFVGWQFWKSIVPALPCEIPFARNFL
jgi:hypothetical protein